MRQESVYIISLVDETEISEIFSKDITQMTRYDAEEKAKSRIRALKKAYPDCVILPFSDAYAEGVSSFLVHALLTEDEARDIEKSKELKIFRIL
jgi:hypothetical protein